MYNVQNRSNYGKNGAFEQPGESKPFSPIANYRTATKNAVRNIVVVVDVIIYESAVVRKRRFGLRSGYINFYI